MHSPKTQRPDQTRQPSQSSAPQRAAALVPAQSYLQRLQDKANGSAVVQRLQIAIRQHKYIRVGTSETGTVREVDDSHKLKKGKNPRTKEYASNETEYVDYLARELAEGKLDKAHPFYGRAQARFGQDETARNAEAARSVTPKAHEGKQMHAPKVIGLTEEGRAMAGTLIFRGMSPNNIKNFEAATRGGSNASPVFIAENPTGTASAISHIENDDRDSPYLSFEAGGVAISAGKYALKPVSQNNTLVDVAYQGGHLKSDTASYKTNKPSHHQHHRAGIVAGVANESSLRAEDYSDEANARRLRSEDAREKAIADKEILIKAGAQGIPADKVPFIALVKQINRDEYIANASNQTTSQALGYYKAYGDLDQTVYYRLYIPAEYAKHFGFDIARYKHRHPQDLRAEMGAITPVRAPLPPPRATSSTTGPMRSGGSDDRRSDTRTTAHPVSKPTTSAWDTPVDWSSIAGPSSGGAETLSKSEGKQDAND